MRGLIKKLLLATVFSTFIIGYTLVRAADETAAALTAGAAQILDEFPAAEGAYEAAAEKLRQALALDPAYAKAYLQVCRLQIIGGPEFGRLFADVAAGSAQRAIFKAIELDPTDGYAWVLRAHLLNDMHRSADAKLALIEAEKLGADSAWLALNWAEVYEAEGNLEGAAKKYQEVVGNAGAKKAALNRALQQLTIYHVARHEWERAEQAYSEAVAINPGGAWLRTKYADALMRHGQFSKAISHARESLQIKDYAATRHVLAIALYGVWANAVINAENRERAQVFYDEAHALVSDLKAVAVEANQLSETRIITQALIQEGLVAKTDVFRRPE